MTDQAKHEAADDLFLDDELSDDALDRSTDAGGKARCMMTVMPSVVCAIDRD